MRTLFTALVAVVVGVSTVGFAQARTKSSGGRSNVSARTGYGKGKRSGGSYVKRTGYGNRTGWSRKTKTPYYSHNRGCFSGYNCGSNSGWAPSYGCNSGWCPPCPPCQGDDCCSGDDGCDQSSSWSSCDDSDGCDGSGYDDGSDSD
jgi:hypothetical protein